MQESRFLRSSDDYGRHYAPPAGPCLATEGFTGFRPELRGPRTHAEQASSALLPSMAHIVEPGLSSPTTPSTPLQFPASCSPQPRYAPTDVPARWPARDDSYEVIEAIEGYSGHRRSTPRQDQLGSGSHVYHSPGRTRDADAARCQPSRIRVLSHQRGLMMD